MDRTTPAEAGLDEQALVTQALEGDPAAWEAIVAGHQEVVFRLAYLHLGTAADAQDVAQETFIRAWRHLEQFDRARPLRPWLLGIAANQARNRKRAAGRYLAALHRLLQAEPPKEVFMDSASGRRQEAERLWQAVRTLRPADQQVIYLRFFLELDVAETAQALAVAPGTVKSRQHRALERLRARIAADFPDLAPPFSGGLDRALETNDGRD